MLVRMNSWILAFLLAVAPLSSAQSVPNVSGTWDLTTHSSLAAIIKIVQTGSDIKGLFEFSATSCAEIAFFTGSVGSLFSPNLVMMTVDMNGERVEFSGDLSSDGGLISGGQYSGRPGECIGRGPYTMAAVKKSTEISPTIFGVINAASGSQGAIAPGEIISIFGSPSISPIGPDPGISLELDQDGNVSRELADVRVRFLGIDVYAPLVYVSAGQVNAVVPYEIAGLRDVQIQIEYRGLTSDSFQLTVTATAPGIFTADGSGQGPGAILDHDGFTLNSSTNPEPRGGVVVLFVTGEGQTNPPGVSGRVTVASSTVPLTPIPLANVSVTINGQPCSVEFVGEAPGVVSGLLQINVEVPLAASPGNVPVQVRIGGRSTQDVVTVSVD